MRCFRCVGVIMLVLCVICAACSCTQAEPSPTETEAPIAPHVVTQMDIYALEWDEFTAFLAQPTLDGHSPKHHYPNDGDRYLTQNITLFTFPYHIVELVSDTTELEAYLSAQAMPTDVRQAVVVDAPRVPLTIWAQTARGDVFLTIDSWTEPEYTVYTAAEYAQRYGQLNAVVTVNGAAIDSPHVAVIRADDADLPLLAVIRAVGLAVLPVSDTVYTIAHKGERFELNTATAWLRTADRQENLLRMVDGSVLTVQSVGQDVMVDNATLQCALESLGVDATIRIDRENESVTIDTVHAAVTVPADTPTAYRALLEDIAAAYPWGGAAAIVPAHPELSAMYRWHESPTEVGFVFADLDGNGHQELLITGMDSPFVYDVYTLRNDEAVPLMHSSERHAWYLYEDGLVELQWSGSAAVHGRDFWELRDGELVFLERIAYDAYYAQESGRIGELSEADDDNSYFCSDSESEADYRPVTADEAIARIVSYRQAHDALYREYTPFEHKE